MFKRFKALAAIVYAIAIFFAATATQAQNVPQVIFATTEGDFVVELYPDKAPKTVENFLQYVEDKHYDGTIFHRVIRNFMIQGGGFDEKFVQKTTRLPVEHEGRKALSKGGQRNVVGTLVMARTNDPNSATAQFFINVKDNDFLDPNAQQPGYTVFGKVVNGMDVIQKISTTPTSAGGPFPSDVPKTPVAIYSAYLVGDNVNSKIPICKVNDVDINKVYRGECLNGLAHGKGRAKGKDVYVGEFKEGNAHGQGVYTWASGDSYDGTWVDGQRTHGKMGQYEGDFLNQNKHGFGIEKYSFNCGFWSCDTGTNRGWWKDNKFVKSCDSRVTCEKLIKLEPLIRSAESGFRCEDARKINQELEAVNASIFSFDSCVSERKFNTVVRGSDPQSMYLAAGLYESDGERSRAKAIYRQIVDRFSKNPLAIKASDRLTRLSDVESVESSNSNAAYQVERSNNQSREAAYQQCMNRYNACTNSCNYKSSCTSGCSLCSK